MNLFALAILCMCVPFLVQIIVGSLVVGKQIKWNFKKFSTINGLMQIILVPIVIKIIALDANRAGVRCAECHKWL